MRIFATILLLLVGIVSFAQNSSIAERARSRREAIRNAHYSKAEQLKAEHEAFRKAVMAKWGDVQMVEGTRKVWVEYSDDISSRSRVDFENGVVTVEVVSDKDEPQRATTKRLEESVATLLQSKGKTTDFKSKVVEQKPVTQKPILENQVDVAKYGISGMVSSFADAAKRIVSGEKKSSRSVSTSEGEKKVSSVTLQLAPDHMVTRAAEFASAIKKYSEKYGIDEPLVYAVIEQESSFNPKARSLYAYGLMQLVPDRGGKDAYMYVYHVDGEPTPEFLYVPDNNIQLGTAYLKIIMTRDFPNVKDRINRMLCTIAAYNTGAGNVARAFTGKFDPDDALPQINGMSNGQLYNYLKEKLHHPEARGYIKGVTSKMKKYVK